MILNGAANSVDEHVMILIKCLNNRIGRVRKSGERSRFEHQRRRRVVGSGRQDAPRRRRQKEQRSAARGNVHHETRRSSSKYRQVTRMLHRRGKSHG